MTWSSTYGGLTPSPMQHARLPSYDRHTLQEDAAKCLRSNSTPISTANSRRRGPEQKHQFVAKIETPRSRNIRSNTSDHHPKTETCAAGHCVASRLKLATCSVRYRLLVMKYHRAQAHPEVSLVASAPPTSMLMVITTFLATLPQDGQTAIALFRNIDGRGSFGSPEVSLYDGETYGWPFTQVEIADVDSDHDLDVLLYVGDDYGEWGSGSRGNVSWFENVDGHGGRRMARRSRGRSPVLGSGHGTHRH